MGEYYVYCYLDSSKKGEYSYDSICFTYEPFYIGKGKGRRIKKGLNMKDNNNYKKNKINQLTRDNVEIISYKIYENLTQDDAYSIEEKLINEIGVFWEGGLLCNVEKNTGNNYKINDFIKNEFKKNHADFNGDKNPMWGKHHTEETKELVRQIHGVKKILQYDIDGNFIREWNGYYQIKQELGIKKTNISACCLMRGSAKSIGGFVWRHKKGDDIPLKIDVVINKKKIYQLEGETIIKEWSSISEASRFYKNYHISECCLGKRNEAAGYKWVYKEEYDKR